MSENIRVLISEEKIEKRIREMGKEISEYYNGEEVHLVSVLKGGVFFTCELAKRLTVRFLLISCLCPVMEMEPSPVAW